MAILFVYTVCSILLFLYDPSTTSSITRSLCLETTFLFTRDPESCAFSYEYAKNSLEDKSSTCQTKCAVKIENVSKRKNVLWDLDIAFGTASITLNTPCPEKDDYTKLTMIINCPNWNTVNISVGGYCRQDEQCQRSEHSAVCKDERCVCKTGYILFNLKCHEGNLALNQSCSLSEQCVGSPYASCLGGKCSCIEGYTAENETSCVQIKVSVGGYCNHDEQCQGSNHSGVCKLEKCVCRAGYVLSNLECLEGNIVLNQSCSSRDQCAGSPYASCLGGICSCIEGYTAENETSCVQSQMSILPMFQHQEANIGTTLGALFGGLFLGVILTTVAVIIIYRRSETHVNKRDELTVKFSDNDACCSAKVVDSNALQNIQTKDKKREIFPNSGSEETVIYNNVYGKPKIEQTQDDVYNHLHEQGTRDDADYYDHACDASAYTGDMGDYSHLQHTTS
uniref:EB domain-containing protein n=1 Tax=Magallana gigas TaxID=29159 RepID=A0A8W8IUG0_MAGGI